MTSRVVAILLAGENESTLYIAWYCRLVISYITIATCISRCKSRVESRSVCVSFEWEMGCERWVVVMHEGKQQFY